MSRHEENIEKQANRDIQILKYLSGGIASASMMQRKCFSARGVNISRFVLERRLNKLVAKGYLVKKQYKTLRKIVTFFALTEGGRTEISARLSVDPESVRYGLPRLHHLRHEIALAEVVRRLLIDSPSKYTLTYMADDKVLRRREKVKRGVYLPDLQVEVCPKSSDPIKFNVEIDAGTKGRLYWIGKLSSWDRPSLVLVVQPTRLPQLKQMLVQRLNSREIYLATADSFIAGGLLGTDWFELRGEEPMRFNF